jgi:predicted DNA-binding transcriptional regulator YafY
MPINKSALIRYKTIDKCLQNRYRRWTLDDLIQSCSDALYEYEGTENGISRRSIQLDLQLMRSDKLGYNAPIIVVDRKYYTYNDPDYSITNIPLTDQDLDKLSEITEILKQFKGFSHFKELNGMVQKLEDKIYSEKTKQKSIIEIEKNENLKGLEYLDTIYQAIQQKQVIAIWYQSFKARRPGKIIFHPYLLKEYRNRWFVLGSKKESKVIQNLALDRIEEIKSLPDEKYILNEDFDSAEHFKYVIGVTVNGLRPTNIHLFINKQNAPYVITKPLHHTQQLISETEKGVEIVIKVIPNFELEREILGFGENIKVLAPESLQRRINERIKKAGTIYAENLIKSS